MAQIQGTMGLMRLDWCDFLIWTYRSGLTVHRVPFDIEYFSALLPKLNSFYFGRFFPYAAKRGLLPFVIDNTGLEGTPAPKVDQDDLSAVEQLQGPSLPSETWRFPRWGCRWRLASHLALAAPAVMRDRVTHGRAQTAPPLHRDQVRFVHTVPAEEDHRICGYLAVSVLYRPGPVVLVAGRTYPYRELLGSKGLGLHWCRKWRGWRSHMFADSVAADELVLELQKLQIAR
eukprot:gnl/TRDRNA2_/TRDRNA2_93724_c1_seq1.p1 gnl/TRDRNA2_/TRDRNA2_93724_c1~~gnl/TRDRNA2_/TRDRNA2_93724_c1_seq1.p1  ORF type:complete len:230 (+),score=19.23 gnl/TRDRNA2_/TRDRNA2_93724_c1_seq1:172-861(+)